MAEPLLTKDSINLGGHKFPIALIGGLAAVATVLLVLHARKSGATASAGAVPANTGVNPAIDYGTGALGPDYSGALANLSQQLTSLGQNVNAPVSSAPAPGAPRPFVLPASTDPYAAQNLYRGAAVWSEATPGDIIGWIPYGTDLTSFAPISSGPGGVNREVTLGSGLKGLVIGRAIGYQ